MTLSPTDTELAEAYEQEHGHNPNDLVLRIGEHILKVGKKLTELGQQDAQQGNSAYPADVFPALVAKVFYLDVDEDHETVQAVADLWQYDYMDGYAATESTYTTATENAAERPGSPSKEKPLASANQD